MYGQKQNIQSYDISKEYIHICRTNYNENFSGTGDKLQHYKKLRAPVNIRTNRNDYFNFRLRTKNIIRNNICNDICNDIRNNPHNAILNNLPIEIRNSVRDKIHNDIKALEKDKKFFNYSTLISSGVLIIAAVCLFTLPVALFAASIMLVAALFVILSRRAMDRCSKEILILKNKLYNEF